MYKQFKFWVYFRLLVCFLIVVFQWLMDGLYFKSSDFSLFGKCDYSVVANTYKAFGTVSIKDYPIFFNPIELLR